MRRESATRLSPFAFLDNRSWNFLTNYNVRRICIKKELEIISQPIMKGAYSMKALKSVLIGLVGMLIIFAAFKASKSIIEDHNLQYVQVNPLAVEKKQDDSLYPEDVDRMISHSIAGTKATTLPVKSDQNYVVYENKLYVTSSQGKTWSQVPDDDYLGYARISEYVDTIAQSNIYQSSKKIMIVYGGRGSENMSIMTSDSKGDYWSVGSISKTATHDLQKGYDELHIDFSDDDRTGYLAAIRNEGAAQVKILAFRSVNTGVTWDAIESNDPLYGEVLSLFGL